MLKKFFTYPVFLVLFLSFIGAMGFGALLKHHYVGGERFQFLQNIAVTIAQVPSNIKNIIKNNSITGDVVVPMNDIIYENIKIFDKKLVTPPPPREFNTYLSL